MKLFLSPVIFIIFVRECASYNAGMCTLLASIGVFHAMAGMAAAMPGLFKFPSAGKEIEASR